MIARNILVVQILIVSVNLDLGGNYIDSGPTEETILQDDMVPMKHVMQQNKLLD